MFSANVIKRGGWIRDHAIIWVALWTVAVVAAGWHFEPAFALLTAQKAIGANAFTTRNLVAPASLTASTLGHDVQLTWPAGLNGNGYNVLGVANGASSNCSAVTFGSLASTALLSYSDVGRFTPQGTWYCYQVQTAYGSWNSTVSNPTAAAQLGFVATSVQMINDGDHTACSGSGGQVFGTAGTLDCGDQVVITFNQAVNTASGPAAGDTVCDRRSNNTIYVASTTTAGNCNVGETVDLGSLTGGTLAVCNCRYSATYTWGNGNQTLTVTVGGRISGAGFATDTSGTWTFNPTTTASQMQSATGAFHICDNNTGGGICLPATSGGSMLAPLHLTPTATAFPSVTPTWIATASPTATLTPAPAKSSPIPTSTPMPTPIASSTATPSPAPPTATPALTATATIQTSPTAAASAPASPAPTQRPTSLPAQTPTIVTATPPATARPAVTTGPSATPSPLPVHAQTTSTPVTPSPTPG